MSVRISEAGLKKDESIKLLRAELSCIDDRKLLKGVLSLNERERKLKVRVLLYLREIDRRRLYLELGYSSMFEFCTERLGYTRSSACRRIKAARCTGRYPETAVMLYSGEVSISTVAMISGIINRENRRELLNRIRGRSYREAEEELSRYRPVRRTPERIRTVFTHKPEKREITPSTPDVGSGEKSVDMNKMNGNPEEDEDKDKNINVEKNYRLQFMVKEKTMDKINRAKSLLSTKYPKGINLELLFDELLDNYLEENDPERRKVSFIILSTPKAVPGLRAPRPFDRIKSS
ncbi:MAG: DUF222 domain-containing protein [Candidatus Krumholzibacteriales bacterium]